MPTTTRTVRVFISSTFSDLKAERNALQDRVFPRLKRYCQRRGWSFLGIDLRWGISNEATLDQSTMRICRAEIARCQAVTPRPNFVVLLGDRHGWRPLPDEIPAAEFEALLPNLPAELANRWYRLDENAICPLPNGTGLDKGRYVLQARTGEFTDYDKWFDEVESPLGDAFRHAARELRLPEEARLKYEASATAQEIHDGAFAVPDAREHVVAFIREIRTPDGKPLREALPADPAVKDFVDLKQGEFDRESQVQLEALKQKLRAHLGEDRLKPYVAQWKGNGASTEHVPRLCMDVYRSLRRLIYAQIEQHSALPPLEEEQFRHQEFAESRARDFTGQAGPLGEIERYLTPTSEPVTPLVVHGASGSGKSTLLAKAVGDHPSRYAQHKLLFRFIGATANSTDPRSLLEGLCRKLGELYGADNRDLPLDLNKLTAAFRDRLKFATAEQPLTLFLDALDQLQMSDCPDLSWLPDKLPAHVRLVLSAIPGPMLEALKSILPSARFLELEPMHVGDAEELLQKWFQRTGRRLAREEQRQAIREGFSRCSLPLYLRLAFEEAQRWRSYDYPPPPTPDIDGLIERLFNRLSELANHGPVLVERTVSYLRCSRHGLSEDEMLDLLAKDNDYWKHLKEFAHHSLPESVGKQTRRLPVVIWSRLYHDLQPYLSWRSADGTALMAFFHSRFNEVADRQLLREGTVRYARHESLAAYFRDLADPEGDETWRCQRKRPFGQLPFHLERAGERLRDLWFTTLGQLRFAQAKCEAQLAYDLVSDLDAALRESRGSSHWHRLSQLRYAVWGQAASLERVPSLSRQQLALRVLDYFPPDVELAGQAKLFFDRELNAKSGLTYPFLPEHARPSAEQIGLSDLPPVRTVVPYGAHVIVFCDGRIWHELDDNGTSVRKGILSVDCQVAAGGCGLIVTAVGKFGFVWNEWPAERTSAQFVAKDEVTLLVCSEKGNSFLAASRDGIWGVISRDKDGKWIMSGKSSSPEKVLAVAAIGGDQWAVVTADVGLHLGGGKQWRTVVFPCEGLTAACFNDAGSWVACSHRGTISVFNLAGEKIYELTDLGKDLKVACWLPGNFLLATTEDGAIHRCSLEGAEKSVTLLTSQRQIEKITIFKNGQLAVAVDYLGKARLFSTTLPSAELAVRELPAGEVVRAVWLCEEGFTLQGVDALGERFAVEASTDGWSASALTPLSTRVDQGWFRDANTLITTEDFNAASSLYLHQLGAFGTVHTRQVWPAPMTSEPFRSFTLGALSKGGRALAISTRRVERGGNELLVFDARSWRILSRTPFEEDDAVDRAVPDDTGHLVLINHTKISHLLTLLRDGQVASLPMAGGVMRKEAIWSSSLGDLDLSADGARLISIHSDGTACLALTAHPERENQVRLGSGVRWCRLSACGEIILLGRGEREVEVLGFTSGTSTQTLCRFFAPFRIEWADVFPPRRVVLVAGKGALWGCCYQWKVKARSERA